MSEETPAVPAEEVWAYAGQRLMDDGSIAYAWFADEGRSDKEMLFTRKRKGLTVGYLYTVKVTRTEDTTSIIGEPALESTWRGPTHVEDPRPAWVARDEAVKQHLTQKRLVNAAAKAESDLDAAIKPLLEIAKQLRTTTERNALTAHVIGAMGTVWFRR